MQIGCNGLCDDGELRVGPGVFQRLLNATSIEQARRLNAGAHFKFAYENVIISEKSLIKVRE